MDLIWFSLEVYELKSYNTNVITKEGITGNEFYTCQSILHGIRYKDSIRMCADLEEDMLKSGILLLILMYPWIQDKYIFSIKMNR